jgi:hypothetical protein
VILLVTRQKSGIVHDKTGYAQLAPEKCRIGVTGIFQGKK